MSTITTQIGVDYEAPQIDGGTQYHNFRTPIPTVLVQAQLEVATELPQGYSVYPNFVVPIPSTLVQFQIEFSEVPEMYIRTVQRSR